MWLSQMLERMEKQQHDMHSGLLEQRQQLQAQEEEPGKLMRSANLTFSRSVHVSSCCK